MGIDQAALKREAMDKAQARAEAIDDRIKKAQEQRAVDAILAKEKHEARMLKAHTKAAEINKANDILRQRLLASAGNTSANLKEAADIYINHKTTGIKLTADQVEFIKAARVAHNQAIQAVKQHDATVQSTAPKDEPEVTLSYSSDL